MQRCCKHFHINLSHSRNLHFKGRALRSSNGGATFQTDDETIKKGII